MKCDIDIDGRKSSVLLNADDIALIAKTSDELQCMLDELNWYCRHWWVLMITDKSECTHF